MTLTIELPDSVAARFLALPKTEQASLTTSLLRQWAEEQLSDADIAAVQEGIDDLASGRHRPLSEFMAERAAFWKEQGITLADAG